MNNSNDIGYQEDPKNGTGIKRARTTGQIRSWEIPRSQKALDNLNDELGKIEFPSVYILFEGQNKVYIGEAKSIYNRLKTHINSPEDKINRWNTALIVNDGRPASQSDFNDSVIRKALEHYLIILLKYNKFNVVAQGERQNLNFNQKRSFDSLKRELNILLTKRNIIHKLLDIKGEEEVFSDELRQIFERSGKRINKWSAKEAVIGKEKVFIRPGSKKPKGWQITFRGRKPGSFIDSLQKGAGYLLFSRGSVFLIPLTEVQKVITDKSSYEQDTIDIYIEFEENKILLRYKNQAIDISEFKILK